MGLNSRYVGEGYVSCSDLPQDTFLRKGALYRLLGDTSTPELQRDAFITILPTSSQLRDVLCLSDGKTCTYPAIAILDTNLQCSEIECDTNHTNIHVVKIDDKVHYEYVRPACVNFPLIATSNNKSFILVNPNGKVAIERENSTSDNHFAHTFFRVDWQDNTYPNVATNLCVDGVCKVAGSHCRCQVIVEDLKIFKNTPSRHLVLSELLIGGITEAYMDDYNVASFDDGTVLVHTKGNSNNLDINTVFEVSDEFGRKRFLKNMKSVVRVIDTNATNSSFAFQNPPCFYGTNPELRYV